LKSDSTHHFFRNRVIVLFSELLPFGYVQPYRKRIITSLWTYTPNKKPFELIDSMNVSVAKQKNVTHDLSLILIEGYVEMINSTD
jgi:hypothetical protein